MIVGLRDHRRLQAFTYTAGLAAIVLLLLPLLPGIGRNINGARIWIHLGPMSFQPGEIAKVLLVIAFAGYLVLHRDALALAGRRFLFVDLPRGRDLGPILAHVAGLAGHPGLPARPRLLAAVLRPVPGDALRRHRATRLAGRRRQPCSSVGAYVGYLALGHVQLRVQAWLRPVRPGRSTPSRSSRASTAWPGAGWSAAASARATRRSRRYSYSDFILPSIGEELGLTGVMAVILLYGILVERGLRTALICRDNFGKLMASGLAVVFALQVFVVIGGVTKLIPLTGLTTPFLSYGGSSPRRQLGDRRAAAAHLRPGPPPTAGADRARRRLRRRRHPGGEDPQMNKPIRNLAVGCMLLFVALLINATYVQYWQADDLTSLSKHPDNKRVRDAEFSRERGAILVRGKAVAESNKSDDAYKFQRVYPQAREYAHLTGFFSRDWGLGGVEATQNSDPVRQRPASCSSTG